MTVVVMFVPSVAAVVVIVVVVVVAFVDFFGYSVVHFHAYFVAHFVELVDCFVSMLPVASIVTW